MNRHPVLAGVLALGLLAWTSPSRADLLPQDGRKYVSFQFLVRGLTSKDRVLFAYPCGSSNGAPNTGHLKIEEGRPITVGRRGGRCELYSIAKEAYEAASAVGDPEDRAGAHSKALAAKAVKCQGAPSPVFDVEASEPKDALTETLEVVALTESRCEVVSKGGAAAATTPPTPSGGCSRGCAQAPGDSPSLVGVGSFCLLALSVFRRRSKTR